MIVKVNHEHGKHINLYEGTHIGFHPKGEKWEDGFTIVIEGRDDRDCTTLEITPDDVGIGVSVFLMNDSGKTVERVFG